MYELVPQSSRLDLNISVRSVVLGSDGTVIEGDSKQVKRQKDIWTFARDISSNDPNWQLVATSE